MNPGAGTGSDRRARSGSGTYAALFKRAFDLVFAALALLILSPVLAATALLVLVTSGTPVIFNQTRAGRGGSPFQLHKFRTMNDHRDRDGRLLPDDARLTPLGRFLRRWSLDELPTLVNVLRGEMSLVGPRPLLLQYVPRYSAAQARRLEVRPGITGWAQVNGRNALTWEEKFARDVWYVDHTTLLLDIRIVAMTLFAVVGGKGVSAEGHATMPEFMGRRDEEHRQRREDA